MHGLNWFIVALCRDQTKEKTMTAKTPSAPPKGSTKSPMTKEAARRIEIKTATDHGGTVPKDSFSYRATRAAVRNSE